MNNSYKELVEKRKKKQEKEAKRQQQQTKITYPVVSYKWELLEEKSIGIQRTVSEAYYIPKVGCLVKTSIVEKDSNCRTIENLVFVEGIKMVEIVGEAVGDEELVINRRLVADEY